ncbi:putative RNA polymerase, sigma-24 subunit, ECF subfamily [Magnetofaba australis IT-1]|uniref:Putative RNA polymerase, sigma-24 subunit, ECF subfamily n=1 Tax=Magnetofaba australis IT-1 TaxID=1434232 RepID=A0A1Y2K3X1_9PROT|nr:putative RNA polymerase, sigma-24 subunit, ECF subfamily [Magnetofaba australis IT-1]
MTSIAMRRCADHWRSAYRTGARQSTLDVEESEWLDGALMERATDSFHKMAGAPETRQILQKLFSFLSAEDRLVLELFYAAEYTADEIAQRMGWSTQKVKVRAHRARHKLRDIFAKEMDGWGETSMVRP